MRRLTVCFGIILHVLLPLALCEIKLMAQGKVSAPIKWTAEELITHLQNSYQKKRPLRVRYTLEEEERRERDGVVTSSLSSYRVTQTLETGRRERVEVHGEEFDILRVIDGRLAWHYLPDQGIYTHTVADDRGVHRSPAASERHYTNKIEQAAEVLKSFSYLLDPTNLADGQSIRLVGEEEITIEGRRYNCLRLEILFYIDKVSGMNLQLWIDQNLLLVRREERTLNSKIREGRKLTRIRRCIFSEIVVDRPINSEEFVFVPPANASLQPQLNPQLKVSPSRISNGSMATDFTLSNLEGKAVSLKSMRGRVVLINFWATWCGPCRVEMPHLEKLYQEYGKTDVRFLAISAEEPEVIRQFLATKQYGFGSLVDDKGEVSRLYGVNGIPHTLLLDRSGRVIEQLSGSQKESDFRTAILKALSSPATGQAESQLLGEGKKLVSTGCLPVLSLPTGGLLMANPANDRRGVWNFRWTGCPSISRFHLQLFPPDSNHPLLDNDNVFSLNYNHRLQQVLAPELALKGWRWRLRGQVRQSWGEWVEGFFAVEPERPPATAGLEAPVLLAPGNHQFFDLQPRQTEVSWRPVPGASRYRVELDLYRNGAWTSETLSGRPQLHDVSETRMILSFGSSQLGRWRVRAAGDNGELGPPSDWWECRFLR